MVGVGGGGQHTSQVLLMDGFLTNCLLFRKISKFVVTTKRFYCTEILKL